MHEKNTVLLACECTEFIEGEKEQKAEFSKRASVKSIPFINSDTIYS